MPIPTPSRHEVRTGSRSRQSSSTPLQLRYLVCWVETGTTCRHLDMKYGKKRSHQHSAKAPKRTKTTGNQGVVCCHDNQLVPVTRIANSLNRTSEQYPIQEGQATGEECEMY